MIKDVLSAHAARAAKVFTDRQHTVGASEVGQCARKVFWVKHEGDRLFGAKRDPGYVDGWGARMRGTIYENAFWEPALRDTFGDNLLYAGKDQKTFARGFLSATPDALVINQPPDVLADLGVADIEGTSLLSECKTADPRTNLSQAKPENIFQTHVQLGLVRECTTYQPVYSVLSYTDASFWDEVKEFPIRFDPDIYLAAKVRASSIMTAMDAKDLQPEGWIAGGRECNYCPFTIACGIERRSVPTGEGKDADPQFIAEIADMARELKALEVRGDAVSAEVRTLQNAIRDRLRERGHRRISGDGVTVVWSSVKGRASFDQKGIQRAAAEAGVDLSKYETVGEPTDRLVVTVTDQSRSAA